MHFWKPTHHFSVSFIMQKMRKLTLGESAYTFYGFSYFFPRQTLRRGQGNRVRQKKKHTADSNHRSKREKHFTEVHWVKMSYLCCLFKCRDNTRFVTCRDSKMKTVWVICSAAQKLCVLAKKWRLQYLTAAYRILTKQLLKLCIHWKQYVVTWQHFAIVTLNHAYIIIIMLMGFVQYLLFNDAVFTFRSVGHS